MLENGTRIYYTGDMANVDDRGTVVEVIPQSKYMPIMYRIKFDSGRESSIPIYCFSKGPGCRFYPLAEWEAEQKAKLDDMIRRCSELQGACNV